MVLVAPQGCHNRIYVILDTTFYFSYILFIFQLYWITFWLCTNWNPWSTFSRNVCNHFFPEGKEATFTHNRYKTNKICCCLEKRKFSSFQTYSFTTSRTFQISKRGRKLHSIALMAENLDKYKILQLDIKLTNELAHSH